ncbi:MAG TPA: DinB family protein [Anaerolineae bacterium]|nr:DinB family protein [Anaerolineae bacterium]
MMTEPRAILAKLDAIRAETLKRLDGLTQEQLDWRPEISGSGEEKWSLGEVFMHLASDEHYLREQIARPLLEGIKPPDGVLFLPPPPPYGLSKDVIQFWFARAREMTRRLIEAWPADAHLDLKHPGGLEPMNGAEWLAAYGGHEAFHHRQIDALIARRPVLQAA